MDLHTFFTCLVAVTLLTLTPGVDTLLVIRNSGRGGWNDGAASSLGICSGLFVHATLSALGISMLLLHTAWAFTGLKLAGAAYLIWLGACSWKQAYKNDKPIIAPNGSTPVQPVTLRRSIQEGFLSNVLNPKTIIFYMAFLPQFIDPAKSPLLQSLLVALIHFCVGMFYQCVLAAMVDRARNWLQNCTVNRVFNGLTGSIMMFIGLRLVSNK
ncbi:MAG: LysE family translocator [Desulfobulbaceae bacterium]|nr:LysE family translocator [Desulfobulbaceae bacterium]